MKNQQISYLHLCNGEFFPPGRHPAGSYGKHRWRLAVLFLFAVMLIPLNMSGSNLSSGMVKFDSSNLQNSGYIDVTVPIYDEDAEDEWPGDGYIRINDIDAVTFWSKEQRSGNSHWTYMYLSESYGSVISYAETYDNSNQWKKLNTSKQQLYHYKEEGENTYALVRIWPSASQLKTGTIKVSVWFNRNSTGAVDQDIQESSQTFSFKVPDPPTLSWSYSSNPGKQIVSFYGNNGDTYSITGKGDTKINSNGTVNVEYDISNSNRTIELKYNKEFTHTSLDLTPVRMKLPALYYPTDFNAEMQGNGNVLLSWSVVNAPSDAEGGDTFEVQRSDDKGFANAKSVGTVKYEGNKTYNLIDKTSEENLNGTFYYRLRRTKVSQWQWLYTVDDALLVEMSHRMVDKATARIVDNSDVEITWSYDNGNIWSDNTDIMLIRTNENKGTTETYAIPRESVNAGVYRETLLSTCDVYSYKIYVKPGNVAYKQQEAMLVSSTEKLYTVEMGSVTSLTASKGYYGDRVELDWETDGKPVDVFSIRSREYGKGGEFKQIDQIDGNIASKMYSYSDTKSVPGIIYEYQVVSIASCGDENQMVESASVIGFRTPTGDIYGRVTFESGQGVPEAEVRAEVTDDSGIPGKSYLFAEGDMLTVTNTELMKNAVDQATLQAWVKTDGDGVIVKKDGMYELAVEGGKPVFKVGTQSVEAGSLSDYRKDAAKFINLTGVASVDSIFVYVDGKKVAKAEKTATVVASESPVTVGGGKFAGNIDEVRIWSKALSADTIARDYGRRLVGNENGLAAYYSFDYSVADNFYDTSYKGTEYNANHGTVEGATISADVPTDAQLGYKGITAEDGSYSIRALPYSGNGTSYMIIPRLGIHTFESTKELRLISADSQTHTVNFTDKSSFPVSGKVTYFGGTVPVEGVSFTVDGTTVMDGKGKIVTTDAKGMFSINVPVGTHEVKAVKQNHVFVNEGKITNSDGTDRDYQDMISGIELEDSTTVRYIGRVAGGAVQEAFPVGHSLSKNNLGDGIKVTLTYQNDAYELNTEDRKETETHFQPVWQKRPNTNDVEYRGNTVTIYPNLETGEFVADLVPEKYKIAVSAPGHDESPIQGSGEELNLTSAFALEKTTNQWVDSISDKTQKIVRNDISEFGNR